MAASPSEKLIKRAAKRLANKYPGIEFQVLRASNGEVAILPVNPETGKPEATNPQRFVVVIARAAVQTAWKAACEVDGIDPNSTFVVFSETNRHAAEYNKLMGYYLDECRKLEGRK